MWIEDHKYGINAIMENTVYDPRGGEACSVSDKKKIGCGVTLRLF